MRRPALPRQFSCVLEANIVNRGYSLQYVEAYDFDEEIEMIEQHVDGVRPPISCRVSPPFLA